MREKIYIFDTTLRDGEQTPGASLTVKEKLKIARGLEKLGVDVIEAGFPAASPGEFEAVKMISQEVKGPIITALARTLSQDIKRAGEALKSARQGRIHTFIATSPIHLKYKLKKSPDEVLKMATQAVRLAREYTSEVEFSPEDASRSQPSFLYQIITEVIEEGASIINIPDTVGYSIPEEFKRFIQGIIENVPNIDKAVLSVHCHNDLGLATANSLAAIQAGARQIECTINGIGERAGNASLEEIVMTLKVRDDLLDFFTSINTKRIYQLSQEVAHFTGIPVQPNKAIVGDNAFRHQAGIHQDGVLKKNSTYEIMSPASIGLKSRELVLGKLSGRHAFKERASQLGFALKDSQLKVAFQSFKELADKKKIVFDEDLSSILEEQVLQAPSIYSLDYIHTVTGNKIVPTATVIIKKGGKLYQEAACGDGPIDAAYKAIDRVCKLKLLLMSYSLRAITGGKDALGEVTVKVESQGILMSGRGVSTDIIEAGARAYINAINRLIYQGRKKSEARNRIFKEGNSGENKPDC